MLHTVAIFPCNISFKIHSFNQQNRQFIHRFDLSVRGLILFCQSFILIKYFINSRGEWEKYNVSIKYISIEFWRKYFFFILFCSINEQIEAFMKQESQGNKKKQTIIYEYIHAQQHIECVFCNITNTLNECVAYASETILGPTFHAIVSA